MRTADAALERRDIGIAMAEERRLAQRRRLWQVTLFGFAVSLPFHAILLAWLGTIILARPEPGGSTPVTISLSAIVEESLSEIADEIPTEDLTLDATDATSAADAVPAIDSPAPSTAVLTPGAVGDLALGGSGGGSGGDGLGGGVGGASFFGVASRGTRFAFIVDVSGSMAEENRFTIAMRELMVAIERLPDNTFFHVIFYSSAAFRPGWQDRWVRARPADFRRLWRWVNEQSPQGGTYPTPAFTMVFALDVPPDVIYFMTDGIIPNSTPGEVRTLNQRGRRVVINTIAFGEESGHELLQQIAEDSGGVFRFVPTRHR